MGVKERFQKSVEPNQQQINKFVESTHKPGGLKDVIAFLDKFGNQYANARYNGNGGSALGLALHAQQSDISKELIKRGADYNQRLNGLSDDTLLMQMTESNAPEMVKLLVDAGADQTLVNSQGRTAKAIALRRHYLDVVKVLDPAFDTSKAPDRDAVDAYVTKAGKGDLEGVRQFLGQYGAGYTDALNSASVTALRAAIVSQQKNVIRELHSAGANMNVKDPAFNFSMAYWALHTKNPDIIKQVIQLGTDFDDTAMESAKLLKCDQFVQKELDKRDYHRAREDDPSLPYPEPTEKDIQSFFGAAAAGDKTAVMDYLNEFGPTLVNIKNDFGYSPAQYVIKSGQVEMLTLLESKGAVIGTGELEAAVAADNKNLVTDLRARGIPLTENALKSAVLDHNDAGMVNLFLDSGIGVDTPILGKATMLHLAAFTGKEEIVKALIDRNAKTDIRTDGGDTADQLAIHAGHEKIAQMIKAAPVDSISRPKPANPAPKTP